MLGISELVLGHGQPAPAERGLVTLGQIVMLRDGIGIKYAKPLTDLLQGERASGPVTIEFQRREIRDGIARQGTTPDQHPHTPTRLTLSDVCIVSPSSNSM